MKPEIAESAAIFEGILPEQYRIAFHPFWAEVTHYINEILKTQEMTAEKLEACEQLAKKTGLELELASERVAQLTGANFGSSSEISSNIEKNKMKNKEKENFRNSSYGGPNDKGEPLKRGSANSSTGRIQIELPGDAPVIHRDYPLLQEYCGCEGPNSNGLYNNGWEHQYRMTAVLKYHVVRERFQKKKCVRCGSDYEAHRPSLTSGCTYDPGFVADIASSKFIDAVSLDRQHKSMIGNGFQLAQSTLCRAVNDLGGKLMGLKPYLLQELRSSTILSIDETRVPTYDDEKRAYGLGWGWALTNFGRYLEVERQVVLFDYTNRRRTIDAMAVINIPPEILLSDGASFYNDESSPGSKRAYCHAHARRRFFETYRLTESPIAEKVVSLYQKLYALEQEIAWSDHETRMRLRQEHAVSVFDQISDICRTAQKTVESASLLGKAIAYFLRHESGLRTYLADGRVEIDNNAVERAIRKIALVRKNCQFAGSEMAADAWMLFASLVATCEVNDIDPRRYLFWLCFKASQYEAGKIPFEELLPWHFAEAEARGDSDHLKFMDYVSGHTGPRYRDTKPGRCKDPKDSSGPDECAKRKRRNRK